MLVPADWSREEVEATVGDYFNMLSKELRGESFNKSEHNRALQQLLNNRSHGAIERKRQNISAILIEEGYPYIDGYKPLGNYQELLHEVVLGQLSVADDLERSVEEIVQQPALEMPRIENLLAIQVDPPIYQSRDSRVREKDPSVRGLIRRNYLEIEARNSSLGKAGELLALEFERQRLQCVAPKFVLAIRHVSEIEGDDAGYDILSFEADGRERLIEVKTTRFGALTPFFASRNEVNFSQQRAREYQVYRLFAFGPESKLFTVAGSMRKSCRLEPFTYEALPVSGD